MLERAFSFSAVTGTALTVIVIDPALPGPGAHRPDQPDYLMLNTVAGQATSFADPVMVDNAHVMGGPTFLQWCRERDLRAPVLPGEAEREIQPADFLPRRVFGEYMAWSWRDLIRRAPSTVHVSHLRSLAVGIDATADSAVVTMDDGRQLVGDLAVVVTGHGPQPSHAIDGWVWPSPLPSVIDRPGAGERVAIAGMGLTAFDVVAGLTEGRGGRFTSRGGRLVYQPSGEEPEILLFSRQGVFPCARPEHPRRVPKPHRGRLTVESLRTVAKDRQLEVGDVLDAIRADVLAPGLDEVAERGARRVLGLDDTTWASSEEYQLDVLDHSRWDLGEARRGLGHSSFKDRMEILRDGRDTLRWVIASGHMGVDARREFFRVVPGLANRAAVGPQADRLAEMHAVIEAGVVRVPFGPNPSVAPVASGWQVTSTALATPVSVQVGTLIGAHLPSSQGPGEDPLRADLIALAGRGSEGWKHLGLAPDGRLDADGTGAGLRIAVYGPPAEGGNYYNNHVLWPGVRSPLLVSIDQMLTKAYEELSPDRAGDGLVR